MSQCMFVHREAETEGGREGGREGEKEVIGFHPSITHVVEF